MDDELNTFTGKQLDQKTKDELEKDLSYTPYEVQIEEQFDIGTIKITPEIAKQASAVMDKYITDNSQYTSERRERINKNYQLIEKDRSIGASKNTQSFMEIFNAHNDSVDDLYKIFVNFEDDIELKDKKGEIDDFIAKNMIISQRETTGIENQYRGLIDQLRKTPEFVGAELTKEQDTLLISAVDNLVSGLKPRYEDTYFFKKGDVIKNLIKTSIIDSGYKENIEKYLRQGDAQGTFICKTAWGTDTKFILSCYEKKDEKAENGKQYEKLGNFKAELRESPKWIFTPVDARNVIIPKCENIPWVIEQIDTTFPILLANTVDRDGKTLKNALYDINMMDKIITHLRKKDKSVQLKILEDESTSESGLFDVNNIEPEILQGRVELSEGHHIPLRLDNETVLCKICALKINNELIPISIQRYPYPKLIYNFIPRHPKDGEAIGYGTPEIIEELNELINKIMGFANEMVELGIIGLIAIIGDHIQNTEDLQNITPGMAIKLKDMEGLSVRDVIQQWPVPLERLPAAIEMFNLALNSLRRTSRTGPTGGKITPNPSATEASSILAEQEKSVDRVALRINQHLSNICEQIYILNMMNIQDSFKLKVAGRRYGKSMMEEDEGISQIQAQQISEQIIEETEKYLEIEPEEIFIDGLSFYVSALDKREQEAVKRHQTLQLIEVLNRNGFIIGPDGQKKIYLDENGTKYEIDEYLLINNLAGSMGFPDIFKKRSAEKANLSSLSPPPGTTSQLSGFPGEGPKLNTAVPNTGNILGGVQNA